jgi:hypothetical protein
MHFDKTAFHTKKTVGILEKSTTGSRRHHLPSCHSPFYFLNRLGKIALFRIISRKIVYYLHILTVEKNPLLDQGTPLLSAVKIEHVGLVGIHGLIWHTPHVLNFGNNKTAA